MGGLTAALHIADRTFVWGPESSSPKDTVRGMALIYRRCFGKRGSLLESALLFPASGMICYGDWKRSMIDSALATYQTGNTAKWWEIICLSFPLLIV